MVGSPADSIPYYYVPVRSIGMIMGKPVDQAALCAGSDSGSSVCNCVFRTETHDGDGDAQILLELLRLTGLPLQLNQVMVVDQGGLDMVKFGRKHLHRCN
ncbi:hypothetical protein ACSBR2_004733 [Camellia fascicularis]